MKRNRILSLAMTLLLALTLVPMFSITAGAATTIEVSTIEQLKDALATAQEGDMINIDNVQGYIALHDELNIPKGVTVTNTAYFVINENAVINNKGILINSGAMVMDNNATIFNSGILNIIGDYSIIYINDNCVVNNSGELNNKGTIISSAVIKNSGIFNNAESITSSNLIENTGTLNSTGGITNNGTIKNSGVLNSNTMYNNETGIIENTGTFRNTNHLNNGAGTIRNYDKFINDGYFYNGDGTGTVINYGGSITGNGGWDGNPVIDMSTTVKVSASVEKLKGSQNQLTITITEIYANGSTKSTAYKIMINNNAAGVYSVGEYKVYVDTKGNTDIRACYFVK